MTCPICSNVFATENPTTGDTTIIDCVQCGNFTIGGSANAILNIPTNFPNERWKISAWQLQYKPRILNIFDIDTALAAAVPSLHQRADRMLRWLQREYPAGRIFTLSPSFKDGNLISIGWNRDSDETKYMLQQVLFHEMHLIVKDEEGQGHQISPKGLLYLEGRKEEQLSIGFCAMWFDEEVQPLWADVIEPATRAAGYEPLRIDGKQHNGKIDDEIMASIRSARFVVSDFTGNRGGVYYEAGFAHGLGLPVIFMCRDGDDLHFDVRQYNCIFWKDGELDEARDRLKNRILATLGQGPLEIQ